MRASLSLRLPVACLFSLCVGVSLPLMAQNPTRPATGNSTANAAPPASTALVDIKSSFDTLRVLPGAFDGKTLKIAILPVQVTYAKRRHDPSPYYKESDYQLDKTDVAQLQKTLTDAFTSNWFAKRHWQLVSDPAAADVRLVIEFKEFWLAAPLQESIHVHKTYTEESARFTLTGRIERTGDAQHLVEFDDKRKVRPIGMPPGRFDRFNSVTFWRDLRTELGIAARQLDSAIARR